MRVHAVCGMQLCMILLCWSTAESKFIINIDNDNGGVLIKEIQKFWWSQIIWNDSSSHFIKYISRPHFKEKKTINSFVWSISECEGNMYIYMLKSIPDAWADARNAEEVRGID